MELRIIGAKNMSDKLLVGDLLYGNHDGYLDECEIRDMLKPYKQEYIQTVVVPAQTDTTTQTDCTTDGSR